jgi:acetyl esterase/lipase
MGRIKVITLDYRQAPFHEYPAASEDVEAVYRELLKEYRPGAIGIYGCSAGGVLAAQAIAWFQANGLPRPGAVGVFCASPSAAPWPFGSIQGDSAVWGLGFIPRSELSDADKAILEPSSWYMKSAASSDPSAFPGSFEAVLAKFPPTLLLVGSREPALSPVIVAHAKFLKLGVDSSLYVMEGATHAAHVMAVNTPEAHDANAYIAHWFNQHLAR